MNCANHPEIAAAAYCRTCGKALCETCKRDVRGVIYCEDCLATRVQPAAATLGVASGGAFVPTGSPHPAVAGVLAGFFPFGVGQAYNGQYARGFVYLIAFIALIFGISANENSAFGPVFGIGLAAFYFWQLIDAVRSAHCIREGRPAPDPFNIDNLFGAGGRPTPVAQTVVPPGGNAPAGAALPPAGTAPAVPPAPSHAVPVGAVVLIGLGLLFLLRNLEIIRYYWVRDLWPLILIGIGAWLLSQRWTLIASGSPRGRSLLMAPVVLLTLGGLFMLSSLGRIRFDRTWPLLLIAIGLVLMWKRVAPAPPPPPGAPPPPPAEPAPPEHTETYAGPQEGR